MKQEQPQELTAGEAEELLLDLIGKDYSTLDQIDSALDQVKSIFARLKATDQERQELAYQTETLAMVRLAIVDQEKRRRKRKRKLR